jgi:hypothetical protein
MALPAITDTWTGSLKSCGVRCVYAGGVTRTVTPTVALAGDEPADILSSSARIDGLPMLANGHAPGDNRCADDQWLQERTTRAGIDGGQHALKPGDEVHRRFPREPGEASPLVRPP